MTGSRLGPIGAIAAHRPILASVVIAFASTAVCAIAYRQAVYAPTTLNLIFLQMLGLCALAPVAIAAMTPLRFGYRLLMAGLIAVCALAFGATARLAPDIMAPGIAPYLSAGGGFLIRTIALSAAIASLLCLLSPLWRPVLRYAVAGVLAACLAAAAVQGVALLMGVPFSPPGDGGGGMSANIAVVGATAIGLTVLSAMGFRFADVFSSGGTYQDAVGEAVTASASVAVFALLAAMLGAGGAGMAAGASQSAFTDSAVIGVFVAVTTISCVLIGGGAMASSTPSEVVAVLTNQRRERIRVSAQRFRAHLAPSVAIAIVAISGIFSLVSIFDRNTALGGVEYAACAIVGMSGALAFVSLRTGILLGALVMVATFLGSWVLGALHPPGSHSMRLWLVLLTAAAFAPAMLYWRDARTPWLRPQLVTETAFVESVPTVTLNMVFILMVLAAASISGYWPEAGALAKDVVVMWLIGGLLLAPFFTGFGALFGRD